MSIVKVLDLFGSPLFLDHKCVGIEDPVTHFRKDSLPDKPLFSPLFCLFLALLRITFVISSFSVPGLKGTYIILIL